MEPTSLADLPSDLFTAPPVINNSKLNPRQRGKNHSNTDIRQSNNPLSTSLPSGLNLIYQHEEKKNIRRHKNQISNTQLENVLPNINDVLSLGENENIDALHHVGQHEDVQIDTPAIKKSPQLPN